MNKKTTIKIRLKPHLEDFVRHELSADENNNIILTRKLDIGKCICSNITDIDSKNFCLFNEDQNQSLKKETSTQKKQVSKKNVVSFILPRNSVNHYIHQYRFLGVNNWSEQKINDFLEVEFKQRMRLVFEAGYKMKFSQKEIIEAILEEYNIQNTAINYETIKKCDYRNKKKTRKMLYATMKAAMF